MEVVKSRALVWSTDDPSPVLAGVPQSAVLKRASGSVTVAANWSLDNAMSLVRLGVQDVPSPILRDYSWSGKLTPFNHQKVTSSFLSIRDRAFCFNEQGCGKTASVIWACDYLMKENRISRVLVLCPLSIMEAAWRVDLFKFAMHRSCSIAHGSAAARRKILTANTEFVIINFDGLAIVKDEVISGGFDLVVVDECSAYKNAQTSRWKTLRDVMQHIPKLWMMTGTPAAQSPVDAYGLAKLVSPERVPRAMGAFRDKVMYKVTRFKWVPKVNAAETVHNALQPAIRFEKADCLDLPPVTYIDREAPLTPQQKKYYGLLKKELLVTVPDAEVSAVNAAVAINKLLQISCGAVYTDSGETLEFDISNRMNVVKEVINESSNKVLVFVPFSHTIQLLMEELEASGITCEEISGKIPPARRGEIVKKFQSATDPRVLVIQPQAASHGLTLTAADTVIWYAPIPNVETYLQANARIDRPGQHHPMTVAHIVGSAVEAKLYKLLRNNISTHDAILDLYREVVEEE